MITFPEVQKIRQRAIFHGPLYRDEIIRLTQSWIEQHRTLEDAQALAGGGEQQ